MKKRKYRNILDDIFEDFFGEESGFMFPQLGSSTSDMDFDDVPSEPEQLHIDESKLNKVEEEGETDTHKWKTEEFSSPDGSFKMFRRTMETKYIPQEKVAKITPKTAEDYKKLIEKAVAEQKYEDAAKFRDKLNKLESK